MGTVSGLISLTGVEMVGEQPPSLPPPPPTHIHTQIPESSLAQMRAKHDRPEYKLSMKRSSGYKSEFGLSVTSAHS